MSPSPDVAEIVARLREADLVTVTDCHNAADALDRLHAELDETQDRIEELEREAGDVAAGFEGDCTKMVNRVLARLHYDVSEPWTASDAEDYILTTIDEVEKGDNAALAASALREEALRRELEIERMPRCDSCGERVTADCPRPRDEPCWREFHKGARAALSDGETP